MSREKETPSDSFNFLISQSFASISLHKGKGDSESHYPILPRILKLMEDRGFQVGRDPEIEKRYKSISKDYWYGRKGDLEFKARRYPAGWSIEFFQNVVFENPNGGEYDFDKYEKMPYLIKLLFRNEAREIRKFLIQLGYKDISEPVYKLAKERIKADYVQSCHHRQRSMNEFELEDLNGQTAEGSYNRTDREGKTIYNGELKYFRDWSGRLARGIVYHDLNNMWWVILNDYENARKADFELFDLTEDDLKEKRRMEDKKPKEYLLRKQKLQEASIGELNYELKRRGIKRYKPEDYHERGA